MIKILGTTLAFAFFFSPVICRDARGAFVVDSLDGDITTNEINNFISTVATKNPAANNWGNNMSTRGTEPEGMRRMYEATRNVAILNHYIRFSDSNLSKRNDKPGGEGRVMWEGTIAPVWPNLAPTDPYAGYAGCESGMVAGHIAACAMLILETPSIWSTTVPDGNPKGYGVTYKDRAIRYLSEVDYVCNNYISTWFIDPATNRVRKPADSRWTTNAGNQSCKAWNRQWMFVMPYLYSARCHDILADNPSYLAKYKDVVNEFAAWFVAPYPSGGAVYYTQGTRNVVKWYYEVPTDQHIENAGHAQHDIVGLFECFQSGYTSLTPADLKPYADTIQFVINLGATNTWAENVDGTGTDTYCKSDFICMSQWNRPLFQMIAQSNLDSNQLNNDAGCKNTGSILAMKRWLYSHNFSGNYRVMARHSNLAMNVTVSSTADGAKLIQYPVTGTANEKWQLMDLGGGSYWFKASHSGKAAVIQGASLLNGALAIQWNYNGGAGSYPNDEWRLDYLANGYYRLVNRRSGKVLEVPGGSMSNGMQLGQWTWAGVNHQQFQISSAP